MTTDAPGGRTPPDDGVEMSDEAVLSFLAASGHGVLSLAGDPPQSLPMSFAVASGGRPLFQSLAGPDSAKADRLRDGVGASLVAYERTTPDDWASVVVTGDVVAVDGTAERQAAFAEQAETVGMSVFGVEAADLEAEWYELEVSSATGRSGTDWDEPNGFVDSR
jgi:nitroimidazol reductase NimA-like FMN-containing flavoprotein (pyridoxamine 5'-phosphate oxidase superfamily)